MSRQPWEIKPSVVKRALNAFLQTGLSIKEIKFGRDGFFSIIPGKPAGADGEGASDSSPEDLKELL